MTRLPPPSQEMPALSDDAPDQGPSQTDIQSGYVQQHATKLPESYDAFFAAQDQTQGGRYRTIAPAPAPSYTAYSGFQQQAGQPEQQACFQQPVGQPQPTYFQQQEAQTFMQPQLDHSAYVQQQGAQSPPSNPEMVADHSAYIQQEGVQSPRPNPEMVADENVPGSVADGGLVPDDPEEEEEPVIERWFPTGIARKIWRELKPGSQMVLIRELLNIMPFDRVVQFLDLSDSALITFGKLIVEERRKNNKLRQAVNIANAAGLVVLYNRGTHDEWELIQDAAVLHVPRNILHSVSRNDIKLLRSYIKMFPYAEMCAHLEPPEEKWPNAVVLFERYYRGLPSRTDLETVRAALWKWSNKHFTHAQLLFPNRCFQDLFNGAEIIEWIRKNKLEEKADAEDKWVDYDEWIDEFYYTDTEDVEESYVRGAHRGHHEGQDADEGSQGI